MNEAQAQRNLDSNAHVALRWVEFHPAVIRAGETTEENDENEQPGGCLGRQASTTAPEHCENTSHRYVSNTSVTVLASSADRSRSKE